MNRPGLLRRYMSASTAEADWVLAWLINSPGQEAALTAAWDAYDHRIVRYEPAGQVTT